jgi:hypothetical protein
MSQGRDEKRSEPAVDSQAAKDDEHVRLLSIFYFIAAGFNALLVPIGLLYAGMGLTFMGVGAPSSTRGEVVMLGIIGFIGLAFTFIAALGTGLKLLTAIRLSSVVPVRCVSSPPASAVSRCRTGPHSAWLRSWS